MQKHDILVIGASAGGVEALKQLVEALPADLNAAIFVVLHIPPQGPSRLPQILNRAGVLAASHPLDGDKVTRGQIYIAPPNHHLIVKKDCIRLARGPKENNCRPAIDVLFRTAARAYGPRVVAIVLSGTLDDGTAGLIAVEQRGGISIVQDPDEAMFDGMPRSAIENDHVNYVLKISEIAPLLVELSNQPIEMEEIEPMSEDMEIEADMADLELDAMQKADRPGIPSPYSCPDCGGVLWEIDEGKSIHFRCRTGHAYSTHSLFASQSEELEEALWNALRALEEKAALSQRLSVQAQGNNRPYSGQRFQQQAQDSQQRASLIRKLLLRGEGNGDTPLVTQQLTKPSKLTQAVLGSNSLELPQQETLDRATPTEEPLMALDLDFKIIALCASAGGLKALGEVLSGLEADFPAAIVVVQHLAPQYPSQLANLLGKRTTMNVKQAETGDVLSPGRVYIAPPDRHLLVNPDKTLSLSQAQMVNFLRPSADLLLESIAASFGEQAIAVILTGTGTDGAFGIRAIKKMGGFVIAQDKISSEFFGMPQAAIETGIVERVVPLDEIAALLINLVNHEQML